MTKSFCLYFFLIFIVSCAEKSAPSVSSGKTESGFSVREIITYLINLQAFKIPIINTTTSPDGKTVLIERLDSGNRIIQEDLYFEGKIITSTQFKYDDKHNITESLSYDDQGKLTLHQNFIYRPDNSLWQIFQENRTSLNENNYFYSSNDQNSLTIDYFQQGMLAGTITYHARLLAKEKNYFYEKGYLVRESTKDQEENSEYIRYYNQDQILTAATFLQNNEFIQHEEYFYQDKLLIRKTLEDQEGKISEYLYQYDEDHLLTRTDLYQDNTLLQSTIYLPEDKYIIEYYALGRVRMSELYENNTLVEQKIYETPEISYESFPD